MNLPAPIKKIPREIRYILLLFFITRPILSVIGVFSRRAFESRGNYHPHWIYSKNLWLDIWGLWDTGWFMNIAANWYPKHLTPGLSNYGFFPLYPLLMRILKVIVGDYYISGMIISNICLVISCIFLYRLVKLYSDENTALRSIKYLFLFPSAFILSAVFTESLFLTLLILCFYYAKRGKWLAVGIAGFFLSLTKSIGVLAILPLLYEYMASKNFKFGKIKADILFLLLLPLGSFVFGWHCYYLTGNFFAHIYTKRTGWLIEPGNPLAPIWLSLRSENIFLIPNAIFVIIAIAVLTVFSRKIGFSYWFFGMLIIFFTLIYGRGRTPRIIPVVSTMTGMMRYTVVIFPFYILFAKLSENRYVNYLLTWSMALTQGVLMVFWSAGFSLIV